MINDAETKRVVAAPTKGWDLGQQVPIHKRRRARKFVWRKKKSHAKSRQVNFKNDSPVFRSFCCSSRAIPGLSSNVTPMWGTSTSGITLDQL